MPALVLILLAIACGASWPTAASGKGARGAASAASSDRTERPHPSRAHSRPTSMRAAPLRASTALLLVVMLVPQARSQSALEPAHAPKHTPAAHLSKDERVRARVDRDVVPPCTGRDALSTLLGVDDRVEARLLAELARIPGALDSPKPLRSRASKYVLQDVFVKLHNFMFAHKMLPLSDWGIGRGDGLIDRSAPGAGDVLARRYNLKFFNKYASLVPEPAKCLQWEGSTYLSIFTSCKSSWSLHFVPHLATPKPVGKLQSREIGVDLVALGKASEAVSSSRAQHLGSFDLILCNQVFEHVRDPWSAARGLSKLLKPGGLLIFTVPFLAKYHEVPKDYFRFTPDGAAAIFEDAGMKVLRRHVGGSSMYTSAYLLGFGTGDFDSTVHDSHALMEAKRYNIGRPRDADYSNTDLTRHNRSLFLESGLVLQRPTSENARA